MSYRKLLSLVLVVLLTAGFAAGCGKSSTSGGSPAKVVRLGHGGDPETLDPRKMTGDIEQRVADQIFEGLTATNAQAAIIPAVAERWEISPDGLSYKFYIRATAKWSNGDPVTAHDFEYAWKSMLAPDFGARYADQLYYLKNAKDYNTGKKAADDVGVKAIDDRTLSVTLEEPCAYFLNLLSYYIYYPVHKKTVSANPQWAAEPKTIICNGPFTITSWTHNSKIEMVKNPQYWDAAKVKLDKLEYMISDNATTQMTMFDNNQTDIFASPPLPEMERLKKENKVQIAPQLATYFYRFNTTKAPFDNPKVRRAFLLAIDRESIVKNVTKGGQVPALAYVPFGLADVKPGDDFRKAGGDLYKNNDIETAKKLLAEAGYPDGKGLPPVNLLYNTGEGHKAIAEALQEMWKKNLGVEVSMSNQEWRVFLKTVEQKDYQIARAGWTGDFNDPVTFLDVFKTDAGNNRTGWGNAKYDELSQLAKVNSDPTIRTKAMHDAEKLLIDDSVIIPVYFYTSNWCIKPKLKGVVMTPLNAVFFKEAYME